MFKESGEKRGIQTVYKGVRMRSRIEARWAVFFDLCGWRWDYEPFDLEGWIPDFRIEGTTGSLLVEVKSEIGFPSSITTKLERAARGVEILILGFCLNPHSIDQDNKYPAPCRIGWFGESTIEDEFGHRLEIPNYWWQNAMLGNATGNLPKLDIGPEYGAFQGRLHSEYDGNPMYLVDSDWRQVELMWKEAGNFVQWNRS